MFDGADPAADGGEQVTGADGGGGGGEVADRDGADEVADRDVDRAALLADGVLAVQAAAGLGDGAGFGVAFGDFVPAVAALAGVGAGHLGFVRVHDRHGCYLPSPASSQARSSCCW